MGPHYHRVMRPMAVPRVYDAPRGGGRIGLALCMPLLYQCAVYALEGGAYSATWRV